MDALIRRLRAFCKQRLAWAARKGRASLFTAGIAVFVGVLLCLEGSHWFRAKEPSIEAPRFLVARRELPIGHPITFLDFTFSHREGLATPLPPAAFTDQDWPVLDGRRLRVALSKGAVLSEAVVDFGGAKRLAGEIPAGYRAYSLEVENPMRLVPGDRVDILFSPTDPHELPVTLVEAALVLRSGREDGGEGVTAALAPSQLQLLEKARQTGKLTLALRHPDEVVPTAKKSRRRSRKIPKRSRIEIWSEGEGGE